MYVCFHVPLQTACAQNVASRMSITGKLPLLSPLLPLLLLLLFVCSLHAGFALVASNTLAGCLSDWTNSQGLGNIGCFYGGGAACIAALLLLGLFTNFGSLGRKSTEA
jgi:hypothetical protein